MTIEQAVGYIGYFALVVGAYFFVRGTAAKNTISIQKEQIDALQTRLDTVEEERDAFRAQVNHLEGQVAVLKDMVTGATAIQTLGEQITRSFSDSHADHAKIVAVLETIATHFSAPTSKSRGRRKEANAV